MTNLKINTDRFFQVALWLGYFTIVYVISGIGIVVMLLRIRSNPEALHSSFESIALRVAGICF